MISSSRFTSSSRPNVLFRPYGLIGSLQKTEYFIVLTCVTFAAAFTLILSGSPISAMGLLGALGMVYCRQLSEAHAYFSVACRNLRINPAVVLSFAVGLATMFAFLFSIVDPAQAAFYQNVEDWLGTTILKDQKDLVTLIVNIIRAMFVVYIAIAVVSVIQKMQQGDDWQTALRIPLVVAMAAAMGDVLAGMIIPGAAKA